MLIRFWGTRGSIPSPGPETVRYGGNTTCIEVITDAQHRIVVDAGTGIRRLGARMAEEQDSNGLHLLLTHCHWDHVQGLPFFDVLRQKGTEVLMRIPSHQIAHAERILQTQLDPLFFPVGRATLAAQISMNATREIEELNDVSVRAFAVDHPGGAVAYRITAGRHEARSIVLAPDSELTGDAAAAAALGNFISGAKILVHDAMYTEAEYPERRGWGHSSTSAAVDLALRSGVEVLVLFHHHPDRNDAQVDALLEECRSAAASRSKHLRVIAAYEGLELEL